MLSSRVIGGGRRELEGDRPAGVVGDLAEVALQRDLVDLDHDPVDVVVDLGAAVLPGGAHGRDLVDRVVTSGVGINPEALVAQPFESPPMARDLEPLGVAELVDPDVERSRGGDRRVELADGAGGRVARIGKGRLTGRRARLVQAFERRERQVGLAADFDHRGRPLTAVERAQAQRDGVDRAQVDGHVLADDTVTARGAPLEQAVAVDQRDRQAVDLRFGDVVHGGIAEAVRGQQPAVATVPGAQLVFVAGVGKRQHGLQMAPLVELVERRGADPLCRRVGRAQLRELVLETLQLAQQQVVVEVADLGLVEDVIEVSVMFDLAAQLDGAAAHVVGHARRTAHRAAPVDEAAAPPSRQSSARAAGVATAKSGPAAASTSSENAPQPTATVATPAARPAATSTGASPT